MRPAISDSLISGQPLYLLYSNSNCGAPFFSPAFAAALATQATGSVRLHVTGKPPTSNGLGVAAEAGSAMPGSAAPKSSAPAQRKMISPALRRTTSLNARPAAPETQSIGGNRADMRPRLVL